ncbi:hypothetical protein CBG46_01175 [Actinobacillus succinogenes]|uniref:DUF6418 domain-containing protein n=1 Tax=Actinobacillus succinogenes (strain ATCC 55618 / DSM 22257 / CCUG 43843 / 130Z) TaxID=339671 RepID=A6VMJ1_ACTSZ|nr:DUF6418 domain-containing protein [Actinobacillus succinogenes]ABR74188.1 conserved hypothetical protein [Actinobacillus succinogenes 130Z]PHI39382.1 hypothetical protein CBG46_01175 [Actinobacillus succinogenes]
MQLLVLLKFILTVLFVSLSLFSIEHIYEINDFVLLGIFLSILLLDIVINPKRNFVNSITILAILLNILGVFAIEHIDSSYYLYEVEQYISYEHSIPLLLLYQWFFLLGINLIVREKNLERIATSKINYKLFFLLGLVSLLLLTYSLIIIHKPAPVLGVDRFEYDKAILGKFGQVTNILFYFSFGLGLLFLKEKKKIYIFFLCLIELAFLLKGHKFWNLVEVLYLFLLPFVIKVVRDKVLKLIFVAGLSVSLFVFAAININVYYFPSFEPLDYTQQRLSQEGQLWWSTYKNYYSDFRKDELKKELNIYLNYNELNQYDVGMYKVMQLNTTPERFEWKLDKLSRYVYSTPALLYYYLGKYTGAFAMLFLGFLLGGWVKLVGYTISSGDLFMSLIAARFFYIIRKGVKDGDIYKFFSLEFIFLIICTIIAYAVYHQMRIIRKTN